MAVALAQTGIDIRDEEHPRLMSTIPQPKPSPGLPFGRNYADKGGHFVPPDPKERRDLFPQTALVAQTEDALVDSRGYVYITDKNHGIFVLKHTSH